ncbi:hypothetical protein [Halostagnicola sp. A-GB9-2]|uniref:hypothetical protein n=1 Tax=Halostagnicola sp. A-GB9-2 TaxID=3048066 RepID=UPI0024C0DA9D|nr:hypothetical protein [Halostagnicola sp. A-GB9-2]MDJ1431759.1 hypothetical protein [Halostagnicola sp. A-GB9-2]
MTTASEPTASDPAATESAATDPEPPTEPKNSDTDTVLTHSEHETRSPDPKLETPNDAPFPYDGTDPGSRLARTLARGVVDSSDGTAILEGSATCPDCGCETINGAGLFACSNCEWSGSLR